MTGSTQSKRLYLTSAPVSDANTSSAELNPSLYNHNDVSRIDFSGAGGYAVPQLEALPALIEYLSEAVLVVNSSGSIVCINSKAAQFLGHTQGALRGHCWPDFLVKRYQPHYHNLVDMGRRGVLSQQQKPTEMAIICVNGDIKDIELTLSYLPSDDPLLVIVMRDLTSHKAECYKLHTLACTDPLTALANRRHFDQMLQNYWDECNKTQSPVSVLIVDVDHFKQFNDQYGHIQGDECLRRIAAAISLAVPRGQGLAARYGGEEFALILPYHDEAMAKAVAVKVQHYVSQLKFSEQGLSDDISVAVSQGFASEINGQFRTPFAMLCAADTALYRAKAEGRNCISSSC
ncbi:sensor domain-containing diguanylate cyclase [uncultured Rheinheimera sp.]|uniref:sensor domain-containing diguanylate cyclase n=1 Tax=uncultured Rheinheimera sp. TaxID=400532 RepID=UPI00259718E0|nr:sensor domain-containing diguanylate cyclase [uncultured Rheinheimera sp.]